MSYSNTSGGTLTLPSPTHAHHVDVGSAVRSLRRSLSRSPSKLHLVRTSSQGPEHSATFNGVSFESPFPQPSQVTVAAATTAASPSFASTTPPQQTSFATPFRPSVKLSLRSARPRATSTKPASRQRASPKSPLKRALSITSDSGNSTASTPSASEPLLGQENSKFNGFTLGFSPAPRANFEKSSRHSMHLDLSGVSKMSNPRFPPEPKGDPPPTSTASPMKRSDALMNFDQTNPGSPVAKRRSLHGISSFGADFNVFDQPPSPAKQSFEIHDDNHNQEYQLTGGATAMGSPTPALAKRSSSLRKSTLQQRYDPRSSWGRRQGEKYLAQQSNEGATPAPRNRPRASLDQFLPPDPRESPFTSRGPLPNPSAHVVDRQPHQPHPLSRSLTTSSSGSSLPDDSPTHIPVQYGPDRPRPAANFARSVPYGAQRPKEPVATPAYKSAVPFQAAFASTGLVSKMNRNPEQGPGLRGGTKQLVMPDTPCKKQVYPSNTYPPSSGSGRKQQRNTFATPATPFHATPQQPRGTFGGADQTGGLFKLRASGHARKASLLSLDGDIDYQSLVDGDLPPTPTKSVLAKKMASGSQVDATPITDRTFPPPTSAIGAGVEHRGSELSSSPLGRLGNDNDSPKTPQEHMGPPDASRLSISQNSSSAQKAAYPPVTPTAGRASLVSFSDRRASITPIHGQVQGEVDGALRRRFDKVEIIGSGEFSEVFRVAKNGRNSTFVGVTETPSRQSPSFALATQTYAVKRIRMPVYGQKARAAKLREVTALQAVRGRENVLQLVEHWEEDYKLYIQTEYCDEGSLEAFLLKMGEHGRLDDFRVWKTFLEISQGLQSIHDAGFIHLDLKPANIFITYAGYLKIGDFGMATAWPAPRGIEGEGDREYMAPEILRGRFDKPADIFSLGLIVLEMACNVILPDNGPTWVALREGDLSAVPALAGNPLGTVPRDATGMPLPPDTTPFVDASAGTDPGLSTSQSFPFEYASFPTHDASNLFGSMRRPELGQRPAFMIDPQDPGSLDSLVRWMLSPDRKRRPTARQLLESDSARWIAARQRAPATVFEGNWGPGELAVDQAATNAEVDTEMTGV